MEAVYATPYLQDAKGNLGALSAQLGLSVEELSLQFKEPGGDSQDKDYDYDGGKADDAEDYEDFDEEFQEGGAAEEGGQGPLHDGAGPSGTAGVGGRGAAAAGAESGLVVHVEGTPTEARMFQSLEEEEEEDYDAVEEEVEVEGEGEGGEEGADRERQQKEVDGEASGAGELMTGVAAGVIQQGQGVDEGEEDYDAVEEEGPEEEVGVAHDGGKGVLEGEAEAATPVDVTIGTEGGEVEVEDEGMGERGEAEAGDAPAAENKGSEGAGEGKAGAGKGGEEEDKGEGEEDEDEEEEEDEEDEEEDEDEEEEEGSEEVGAEDEEVDIDVGEGDGETADKAVAEGSEGPPRSDAPAEITDHEAEEAVGAPTDGGTGEKEDEWAAEEGEGERADEGLQGGDVDASIEAEVDAEAEAAEALAEGQDKKQEAMPEVSADGTDDSLAELLEEQMEASGDSEGKAETQEADADALGPEAQGAEAQVGGVQGAEAWEAATDEAAARASSGQAESGAEGKEAEAREQNGHKSVDEMASPEGGAKMTGAESDSPQGDSGTVTADSNIRTTVAEGTLSNASADTGNAAPPKGPTAREPARRAVRAPVKAPVEVTKPAVKKPAAPQLGAGQTGFVRGIPMAMMGSPSVSEEEENEEEEGVEVKKHAEADTAPDATNDLEPGTRPVAGTTEPRPHTLGVPPSEAEVVRRQQDESGAARPSGVDGQMEDVSTGEIGAEREQAGEPPATGMRARKGLPRGRDGWGEVYQGSDEDSLFSDGGDTGAWTGAESDGGGSPGRTGAKEGAQGDVVPWQQERERRQSSTGLPLLFHDGEGGEVLQFSEIFGIQGSFWGLLAQLRTLQQQQHHQGQGQERPPQHQRRGPPALGKGVCGAAAPWHSAA